jgi:hypothetical protein
VRQAREGFGVRRDGRGHGVNQRVDLLLGEFRERGSGGLRASRERPRLGDGGEIAVRLGHV